MQTNHEGKIHKDVKANVGRFDSFKVLHFRDS